MEPSTSGTTLPAVSNLLSGGSKYSDLNANGADFTGNNWRIDESEAFRNLVFGFNSGSGGQELTRNSIQKSQNNENDPSKSESGLENKEFGVGAADPKKNGQATESMSISELIQEIMAMINQQLNEGDSGGAGFSSPSRGVKSVGLRDSGEGSPMSLSGSDSGGGISPTISIDDVIIPDPQVVADAGQGGVDIDTSGMDLQTDSSGCLTEESIDKVNALVGDLSNQLGVEVAAQAYHKGDGTIGLHVTAGDADSVSFKIPENTIYSVHSHPSGNLTPSSIDLQNEVAGAQDAVIDPNNPTQENIFA